MSDGFDDARAKWDARYAGEGYLFGKRPSAWLTARAEYLRPGMQTLVVADGDGRNSVWLAQQGLAVTAFDLSPVGVAKAEKLAAAAGVTVHYSVEDCDQRVWRPDAFDVVVALFIQFADPGMRSRLFANMAATLRPGGLLLLHGYTPGQLDHATGGPGRIDHLYTAAMLRAAFAGFEMIELSEYEAVLDEGKHAGPSALIGMVARKPTSAVSG